MKTYDVVCPICGTINKDLYLEDTEGWMECQNCEHLVPAKLALLMTKLPQHDDKHIPLLHIKAKA